MEHKVLLLLLLAALANAGPLAGRHRGGCAWQCSKPGLPLAYATGKAYTFDYSTEMRTHIKGASEESSGLRLTAKAVFDFLTPCEVAMRLEHIRVTEMDPSGWQESPHQSRYESELVMSDAHFVMTGGVVSDVCADVDEPEWVLNIKKAVISLMQNTNAGNLDVYKGVETDISGQCKVAYSVRHDGPGFSVTKVTDLMSCLDQQKVRSSFQSSSYRTSASIQSMPLTKANRTCQAAHDKTGHLKTVHCSEEHVFRPFSTDNAGAVTLVEQRMRIIGIGGMVRIAHDHRFKRSKLEYQHHNYKLPSEQPVEDVKVVLSSLCELGSTIAPRAPVLFSELIYRLRELSTEQLESVRRDVESLGLCRRNNQMAKQFFYDALPAVTTAAAVGMMKAFILNGQVSTNEADAWLTSLAFVQEPSKEMLQILLPLLEVDKPRSQAMLGITALVHQYCKSQTECQAEPVVKNIGVAVQKLIGSSCSTGDRRTLLVALKAIGNAGYFTELLPSLVLCAQNQSNLMEVRVAAIEALRRTPCSVDRKSLVTLIRSMDLDSELRITAYLGLMTCPTVEVFDTVRELLTAESSNQLASFVWTHLTNLLETSDPHKQDVRLIVEDVKLKKQYDMDKLKFSRNVEKSFFSRYLNTGAKVESNLIWSQNSFLPRSATLNMTLDLFGKSLNFLEVGGRAQGLEVLLEKYLGPSGGGVKKEESTNTQLTQLDNTFKVIEENIGGNLDIKIFGHQVAFLDLWKEDLERSGNNLLEFLNSLKHIRAVNWHKSISFLDTQVTIPTISGFPLRLGVNGTASFILKASAKLNLKKLMQWPPEFEMEGKLAPSGAVHVSGMLGISTIFGEHGVKMVTTLHSNTEIQASIRATNGEELQVEIKQPREHQNILNAKTSFFVIHRSIEREQNMRRDLIVERKSCSGGGALEQLLGVEFCAGVRFPSVYAPDAPRAPLAAGLELDVSMAKRDRHTGYLLHLINKKDGINRHWKALVDMPGSIKARKLLVEFKTDVAKNKLEGVLVSPWKKGRTELNFGHAEAINLLVEIDDLTYVSAKASYRLRETEEQIRMELENVEFRLLDSQPIKLQGVYGCSKLPNIKNWEISGKIENLFTKPIGLKTNLKHNEGKAAALISVSSPIFNGIIDSNYSISGDGVVGATSVSYQFGNNAEQTVRIEPTTKLTVTTGGHDIRSSVKCVFSEVPSYNTRLSFMSKRSNYNNHELDLIWENDRGGQQRRLFSRLDLVETSSGHEHTFASAISYMGDTFRVTSAVKHNLDWSQVTANLALPLRSRQGARVISTLDFSRQPETVFYEVSFKSGFGADLFSKLQRSPENGSVTFGSTMTMSDINYSIRAELQQKDHMHKVSGSLSLPKIANVGAELSIDASASEPSITVKITTPSATCSAGASVMIDDRKFGISTKVACPGVHMQTRLHLSSEDDMNKFMAELYWDPRREQSDGFLVDGSFQTIRKAHLLERIGQLRVGTPTGAVTIRLNERNEPLKSNKYVEIEYANGKKASANFMYDINDGWTEKGIVAMLRLVTPVRRYEDITLKLDGYGSLRVRKLQIESIVNERRFKADLLVKLGNINNFHSRLSIVTPWAQASFIKFELNHWLTSSEIKSKLDVEFKTKKITLEVHGYNKGTSSSRDIGLMLQSENTFKWLPKMSLYLSHRDDLRQFASSANVAWNSENRIVVGSDFNFNPSRDGVESRGNISIGTPFQGYETFSFVWNHKSNRKIVKSSSQLTYMPGKVVDLSFDGYNELTPHAERQFGASIVVSSPFMEEFVVKTSAKKGGSKYEAAAQVRVPHVGTYQADILTSEAEPRMHVKLETPHKSVPRFGFIYSQRKDSDLEYSSNTEIYWGNEIIVLRSKSLSDEKGAMLEFVLQTPFEVVRRERLLLQNSMEENFQKLGIEFSHLADKVFGATLRRQHLSNLWDYRFTLETALDFMRSVKISGLAENKQTERTVRASVVYNEAHTMSLDFSSLLRDADLSAVLDISAQSPAEGRSLKVIHKRTAEFITTQLLVNAGTERTVNIKNVINNRGVFELEATSSFQALLSTRIHMWNSNEDGERRIGMVVKHSFFTQQFVVDIQCGFKGPEKAQVDVSINIPSFMRPDWKFSFNHRLIDLGKLETAVSVHFGIDRIEATSELTMTANEIAGNWKIRTPFAVLEEISLRLKHKGVGRFVEHQHALNVQAIGSKIQLTNSLQFNALHNVKLSSTFQTNIPGLESVNFNAAQTIESSPLSYDASFYIKSSFGTTVAAGISGKIEASGFEGTVYAKIPSRLQNLNATVRLTVTDWLYWTMNSNVAVQNSMWTLHLQKEVAFRGLKTTTASLQLRMPDSTLSGNLRVEALRAGIILVKGTLNNNEDSNEMNMKLERLSTNRLKGTFHLSDMPVIVAESELEVTHDQPETIGHKFTVTSGEIQLVKNEVKFTSGGRQLALRVSTIAFGYKHDTSLEFQASQTKISFNASHSCNWMRGPVLFKFEAERRYTEMFYFAASTRLDAPYFDSLTGSLLVNLQHALNGITEFDLRLPNINRICSGITWNFLTNIAATLSVELPYIGGIESKLGPQGDELVFMLEMPTILSEKWELRVGGTITSLSKANLKFHLLTSLPNLKEINIQHAHNFEDDNQLNSELSLPGWTKKVKVHLSISSKKVSFQLDGPELNPIWGELFLNTENGNYEMKLAARWNFAFRDQDLEFRTKISAASTPVYVSFDVKLPLHFAGYADAVQLKLEGDLNMHPTTAFNFDLQFALSSDRPLSQLMKATFGSLAGKRTLAVNVPALMSAVISHEGYETAAKITVGDATMELRQRTIFNAMNDFEIIASAKVNGASSKQAELHLRHHGNWRQFKNRLSLKLDLATIFDYEGQIHITDDGSVKAEFGAETPATDRMSLRLELQGRMQEFTHFLEIASKYHAPLIYKGLRKGHIGDFSVTVPVLGKGLMQMKRLGDKSVVSLYANRDRKLKLELENEWSGTSGKASVKVSAIGQTFHVRLENEGSSWRRFKSNFSIKVNDNEFKLDAGHDLYKMVLFSAQLIQPINGGMPQHSVVINYLLDDPTQHMLVDFQLVKNYETWFGIGLNKEGTKFGYAYLKTSLQGLRYSSLTSSLTVAWPLTWVEASLRLQNDYTGENILRLEVSDRQAARLVFKSAYLGKHFIRYSARQLKKPEYSIAEAHEVEVNIDFLKPILLKLDFDYSPWSAIQVVAELVTHFEGLKDSKISLIGHRASKGSLLSLKFNQEYIGNHGVSLKIQTEPRTLSASTEIESELPSIGRTKLDLNLSPNKLELAFQNGVFGTLLLSGHVETKGRIVTGGLLVQSPWKFIGTTSFSFEWRLGSDEGTKLELKVKTPMVGENKFTLIKVGKEISSTEIQSRFQLSVYLEKFNERFELQSTFTSKMGSSSVTASGSHSVQCSRLGVYSITEKVQVDEKRIYAAATVRTPFSSFDKTGITFDLNTKDKSQQLTVQLDTKLFGMQELTIQHGDDDLTGHLTVMTIRNELTVTGWRPKLDSSGARILDCFASIASPFIRTTGRLSLKPGQFMATASTTMQAKTATAATSATWEFRAQKVLIDVKANLQMDEFNQIWNALCDVDFADKNTKQVILRLVAPVASIDTTELALTLKVNPVMEASVLIQSPNFGNVKVRGMWHAANGLFTAPISGMLRFDNSFVFVPKFEVTLDHVQKHEHIICEFNVRDLETGKTVFKADSTLDALNKKLLANVGANQEIKISWQSQSDLSIQKVDERIDISLNQQGKFTLKTVLDWREGRTIIIKVTTPFSGYERLGAKLVASVTMPFDVTAKLLLPNRELKIQTVLDLSQGLHARVALKLPGLPEVELAFQAAGTLLSYKFELTAQYGGKRFSTLINWDIVQKAKFRIRLETPVADFKLAEINAAVVSTETMKKMKLALAFNDYENEVKFTKEANNKGLKLRLHYPEKLIEVQVNRQGHDLNRMLNLVLQVNGEKLVDVSLKATLLFSNKNRRITLPHSGFVEVRHLFGTGFEKSSIEWGYRRIENYSNGLHDLSLLLRAKHMDSHFNYHMSMLHGGKFSVKTSLSAPRYGIRLEEMAGTVQISTDSTKGTQLVVDLGYKAKKLQLVCITNRQDSISIHLSGLKGTRLFANRDSLALQAQLIRTQRIGEINIKISGHESGDFRSVLSLVREKELRQLTISLEALKHTLDGHLLLKTRSGWLSSIKEHTLEGRISLYSPNRGAYSTAWSAKLERGLLEADVQVSSGMVSDMLLRSKFVLSYHNGLHANAELVGFGVSGQVLAALSSNQLNLVVNNRGQEIASVVYSYERTGYRTKAQSQRLFVLYQRKIILGLDTKLEIVRWKNQFSASARLVVADKVYLRRLNMERNGMVWSMEMDWDNLQPIKMVADIQSLMRSKVHIAYGSHEILTQLRLKLTGSSLKAEFGFVNPWLPVQVKLNHIHRREFHKVMHKYEIRNSKYMLDSSVALGSRSINAQLRFNSPTKNMQVTTHASQIEGQCSLSHTVMLNGLKYLQIDGNLKQVKSPDQEYQRMRVVTIQMTMAQRNSWSLPPVKLEMQHNYNSGWKGAAWIHRASVGDWKAVHTGHVDWNRRGVGSKVDLLGHVNEINFGNGVIFLKHTAGLGNIGTLSGAYNGKSSTLKFNSDLTSFHTTVQLDHHIGRREGSIVFLQTGSHSSPEMSANWNLNAPTLRGELKVGNAHVTLEHMHTSNRDFSCRYRYKYGSVEHEFKSRFAIKSSTREEYHTEIEGYAEILSALFQPFLVKFVHHHKNLLEHRCAGKIHFSDWKLLHTSVIGVPSRKLTAETYIHRGTVSLFESKVESLNGTFTAKTLLGNTNVYKVECHYQPASTNLKLSSDLWNIDTSTAVQHQIVGWHQGKLFITHTGFLPHIEAGADWQVADSSKRIYAKLFQSKKIVELDLSLSRENERYHFSHKVTSWLGELLANGVYDRSSTAGLTEATLRVKRAWARREETYHWAHRFGPVGYATIKGADRFAVVMEGRASWDFSSQNKSFDIYLPKYQLGFKQDSPTSGQFNVRTGGMHILLGVLDASSTWQTGKIKLNNSGLIYTGNWSLDGMSKRLAVDMSSFKLNLQHTIRGREKFDFVHSITCIECQLSNILPKTFELNGKMDAAPGFISGSLSANYKISSDSSILTKASWNFGNEEKILEILAPMINGRFAHQHASLSNFSFNHTLTVSSTTHTAVGGIKTQPSIEFGRRIVAHMNTAGCRVNFEHHHDGLHRHRWNHTGHIGGWRFAAIGHHHPRDSFRSEMSLNRADTGYQQLFKNITWDSERFEYQDAAGGTRYHHVRIVNTDNEKSAWLKTRYYEQIVGAGITVKKTCTSCYHVEVSAAGRDSPKLVMIAANVELTGYIPVQLSCQIETPLGKVETRSKIQGLKWSDFKFVGSVSTESGRIRLDLEIRAQSMANVAINAAVLHSDLLPLQNTQLSFSFSHKIVSRFNIAQVMQVRVGNGIPFIYNFSSQLVEPGTYQWKWKSQFSVRLMSSFLEIETESPFLYLSVKSSSEVVPDVLVKLQTRPLPADNTLDVEFRVGDKAVEGNLTMAKNSLQFQFNTPFSNLRQLGGEIAAKNEKPNKLSVHAGIEINNRRYFTSLSFDADSVEFSPKGMISLKIETPHKVFNTLHILAEHRKSEALENARLMVAVNERALDIVGNITSSGVRLYITLPIQGYQNVGFKANHDGEGSQPRVHLLAMLPHGHYIKVQAVGTYDGLPVLRGQLNIETSFDGVRRAEVGVRNQYRDGVLEHSSSMLVNRQRWHDVQLRADRNMGEIRVNYTQPITINYRFNIDKVFTSELKVTIGDSVTFHINAQVEIGSHSTDGKSFLKLRTPYRTVVLNREIKITPNGQTYKLEFTPNEGKIRPLVFNLIIEDKSDYSKTRMEARMAITIPTRRIEASIDYQALSQETQIVVSLNWDATSAAMSKVMHLKSIVQYVHSRRAACRLELKIADKRPYAVEFNTTMRDGRDLHSSLISIDITENSEDTILLKLQVTQEASDSLRVVSSLSQASSKVSVKVNGEIKQTTSKRDGSLSIEYADSKGHLTVARSVIRISTNSIRVDLMQPKSQCSIELKRTVLPEYTSYMLSTHGQKLELRLSSAPDLQIIYEPRHNDRFLAAIGYSNKWHLRAEIHHIANKVRTQHLLADMQMKSSNLMKVRLHWNPTDIPLRYSAVNNRFFILLSDAYSLATSVKHSCVQEILAQARNGLILPDLTNVAESVAVELQPLRRDIGYMNVQFEEMYARNEFYSRDILGIVRRVAFTTGSYAAAIVKGSFDAYSTYMHPPVSYVMSRAGHHAGRYYMHAARTYAAYQYHKERLYRRVNEHVMSYVDAAVDSIRPALDSAHDGYLRFAGAYPIGSVPSLRGLHTRVARSVSQLNYKAFDLLHADIRGKALSVHQSIEAGINHVTDQAAGVIGSVTVNVTRYINRFVNSSLTGTIVSGAYTQSKWLLDHFDIEQNLKDFARDNFQQGVEHVRQNTIGLATDYLGISKNAILVNDFEQGKFEAHLHSPMRWTDMQSLPSSGLENVKERLANDLNSARHSLNTVRRKMTAVRDVVYDSIPDFDMPSGSWIPKFKGVASVIGDHIVTFDGRHFDFRGNGECSYLLARDFRGRGWAIGMAYSRAGKSLEIFAYGKRILVTPRLHVLVDGVHHELPLNIGNLSVVRTGSGLRAKDLGQLFTVTIDPEADMHTVSVSGWYHGRLGGLLGNFDNEPFNDLVDSRNRRMSNVLEFTGSWQMGACRHTNLASIREVPEQLHQNCLHLFGSSLSPFRRCYTFVDPAPFRDICAQERSAGSSQQMCRASIAYVRHCEARGIRGLQAPNQCLRCTVRSTDQTSSSYRELTAGQKLNTQAPATVAADVVLVLEERGCIGRQTLSQLPSMVAQLQRSLGAAGISDVRFGLLGFGNPSHHRGRAVAAERSRPHWHTMGGELMGSVEQLAGVLARIDTHNTADASVDGARGADALEAIRLAARFGELRPGAARHVILIACDECHEARQTLHSVQQALAESDVQLHLLTEAPLPTYFYGRRSQAFGMDAGRAFSVESPEGSAALHGYTRRPAGKCASLAQATGGSVFDLRYLRRRQYAGGLSTQFIRTFADRLAADVAGTRATAAAGGYQECLCAASRSGTRARLTCRPL